MTDEVLKRIDALAAKLGVTADHIWSVLMRQARIEGIEWVLWGTLWLIVGSYMLNRTLWMWRMEQTHNDDHFISCIFGGIAGVLYIFSTCCLANILGPIP